MLGNFLYHINYPIKLTGNFLWWRFSFYLWRWTSIYNYLRNIFLKLKPKNSDVTKNKIRKLTHAQFSLLKIIICLIFVQYGLKSIQKILKSKWQHNLYNSIITDKHHWIEYGCKILSTQIYVLNWRKSVF